MKAPPKKAKRRPTLSPDRKRAPCFLASVAIAGFAASAMLAFQAAAPAVNVDSQVLAGFAGRLAEYMKLRKTASERVHPIKPTTSQAAINRHEQHLAHQIREAREHAHQGDIFTPETAEVFRRLTALAGNSSSGVQMKQSLRHAEPVNLILRVNRLYPDGLPLQSSPPTLLANLPPLPKELDYRVVGHSLILRDIEANLIIDFIDRVIP